VQRNHSIHIIFFFKNLFLKIKKLILPIINLNTVIKINIYKNFVMKLTSSELSFKSSDFPFLEASLEFKAPFLVSPFLFLSS